MGVLYATQFENIVTPVDHIDYSMSEITARAKLAIRGLGYSWGVAEDAGRALLWLEQRDLPGLLVLAKLCQHIDQTFQIETPETPSKPRVAAETGFRPQSLSGDWLARDGELCPILTGIALSDCGLRDAPSSGILARNVLFPLLLLPFAADLASTTQSCVQLRLGDSLVMTDGEKVSIDDSRGLSSIFGESRDVQVRSEPIDNSPIAYASPKMLQRASVANDAWLVLEQFAQRTYAPATEESRIRGAGAGTSDND